MTFEPHPRVLSVVLFGPAAGHFEDHREDPGHEVEIGLLRPSRKAGRLLQICFTLNECWAWLDFHSSAPPSHIILPLNHYEVKLYSLSLSIPSLLKCV